MARCEVAGIYTRSCVLLVAVSFPLFAGLAVSLPAVSEAVLGRYERTFVVFGGMLTVGWFANALSLPAWSVNIGKRELTLNGMTQAIVLACNAGLGWMLGYLLGGVGVVTGSSAALTIGALFLTITYHRQSGCAFREWFPVRSAWVPFASVLATILCWMTHRVWGHEVAPVLLSAGTFTLFALLVLPALLLHPYREMLIHARFQRQGVR